MARNYTQGKFFPKNPHKYKGDVNNIVFRSSWEFHFCRWCDRNVNVIEWSSEEIVVPYFLETDQKWHRYFTDFLVKLVKTDGTVKTCLIEIKPHSQIVKPLIEGKLNKKTKEKALLWIQNQTKWRYAREFAAKRGWDFMVLSEKDLGLK